MSSDFVDRQEIFFCGKVITHRSLARTVQSSYPASQRAATHSDPDHMVLAITCKHAFPRRWAQSRQQQTSRLLSSCGVFQAANRSRSSASNTRLYAAICAFVPGKAYFTKRQHLNVHSLRTSSKVVASSATPQKQTIDPETGGYSRSFLLVRVAVFFR